MNNTPPNEETKPNESTPDGKAASHRPPGDAGADSKPAINDTQGATPSYRNGRSMTDDENDLPLPNQGSDPT